MSTFFLLALVFLQMPAAPVTAHLRGQITGAKDLSGLPITLYPAGGSALHGIVADDGSFAFTGVSRGSYTLRAPGFTTMDVFVDGTDVHIELKPMYSGPGVRVGGKVTDRNTGPARTTRTVILSPLFSGPNVTSGVSALEGSLGRSLEASLEAWVRPDGRFEFPAVPPGSYMLRTLPTAPATSRRIEVDRKDVRDLEIAIPYQIETTGRVVLEGRDLGPNATIQATQPAFTMATGIQSDGSFKLRLTEGENQVSMARLPAGFSVKRISFGALDITNKALKVDSRTPPQEILITLEAPAANLYSRLDPSNQVFTDAGATSRTQVAGRVSVVDTDGKPYPVRPSISMVFRESGIGITSTSVAADGTFAVPLADSRYVATVGSLPEGYSIKSMSSGSINLFENPLVVDARKAPDNIEVVLEYTPEPKK